MTTPAPQAALLEAARAVCARWDSPAWKWGDGPTADLIATLRAAIAQAEAAPKTLTDEQIDRIAENCAKSMPDGIRGFCVTWGWRQFARELLDVCAGYQRAQAEAAQPVASRWQLVPVQPTQEMHDAARAALANGSVPMPKVCRAMLAAAPQPAEAAPRITQAHWDGLAALEQSLSGLTARAEARRAKFAEAAPKQEAVAPTNEQADAAISAWFSTAITTNEGKDRGHPFREKMRAAIRAALSAQPQQPAP